MARPQQYILLGAFFIVGLRLWAVTKPFSRQANEPYEVSTSDPRVKTQSRPHARGGGTNTGVGTQREVTQSVAVPGTPLAPGLPPFTSAELPRIPVMSYPSKQDHIAAGKSRDSSSHWPPARGGSQLGSPNLLGTWHGGSWHDSATIDVEGLPIVAKMQQRHAPDRDNSAAPSAVALGPVRSQGAISGLSVVVGQGGTARASNARAHLSRQQKPSSPPGDGNVISLSTNHKGAEPAKALNDGHLHGLPPTQHQRGWSAAHSKPGSGGREGAADRIQENAASAKLMVEVGEVAEGPNFQGDEGSPTRDGDDGGEDVDGEGSADLVGGEDGGYPHADALDWLRSRLNWLHLMKGEGFDVNPVVLSHDSVVDGKTKYTVWMSMQRKTLTLEETFLGPQLPKHDYGAGSNRIHQTCALVGNSGILLGSNLGHQIDSHDAVMRINYPPIAKFEKDVGSRTTYDFSNRENARRLRWSRHSLMEYPNRKYPTTLVFFELSSPVNRRNLFVPLMEKFPGQKIHYLHPDFVFRSMRLWNELQLEIEAQQHKKFKKKPMSGWLAMMFMTQMCEKLDVYGFEGYKNPKVGHPYHYFDKVKAVLKHHSFDFAIEAYKLLSQLHPIELHGVE